MPTSQQEKDLNVIHILGNVILAWKQLSTFTCFKTIVRLMHSRAKQALGVNSNKRYGYKLCNQLGFNQAADPFNRNCHSKHQFKSRSDQDHIILNQKQLICAQDVDSKVGNDLSLTRVSFVLDFIRVLSEMHGMSQNRKNNKRVTRKTKMNKMNVLVNPLTITQLFKH